MNFFGMGITDSKVHREGKNRSSLYVLLALVVGVGS